MYRSPGCWDRIIKLSMKSYGLSRVFSDYQVVRGAGVWNFAKIFHVWGLVDLRLLMIFNIGGRDQLTSWTPLQPTHLWSDGLIFDKKHSSEKLAHRNWMTSGGWSKKGDIYRIPLDHSRSLPIIGDRCSRRGRYLYRPIQITKSSMSFSSYSDRPRQVLPVSIVFKVGGKGTGRGVPERFPVLRTCFATDVHCYCVTVNAGSCLKMTAENQKWP